MIYCYKYGLIIQPFMVGNLLQYDVHVGNKVICELTKNFNLILRHPCTRSNDGKLLVF